LLSNNSPKSLLSGKDIELDRVLQGYNRSEFHHTYPRAFLRDAGYGDADINTLANFCFLSAAENRNIGRKKPSVYVKELGGPEHDIEATLASAFCKAEEFNDDYDVFLKGRLSRLVAFAEKLTA
jgi:hypothetical protein